MRPMIPTASTVLLLFCLGAGVCSQEAVKEDVVCDSSSCLKSQREGAVGPSRDQLLLQLSTKPAKLKARHQKLLPAANMSHPTPSIKVMSYNLMGWSSFNANPWKGTNVLGKINAWKPDLLGAQEVEKGGWGYNDVEELLTTSTGLAFAGGSQFFRADAFQKLEDGWTPLVGGYWMSMALYNQTPTGEKILFYDSHWKHGYGLEQAETVASKIAEDRLRLGSPPTILVGDTNQFCQGPQSQALLYLKGKLHGNHGACPVELVDVHEEDEARSFSDNNNPDCRVDFMLASKGQWSVVQAAIDREGMGAWGSASDHAALMATLVPLFHPAPAVET
mmetsp:Transcript_18737/g.35163  ORF Transcript_18737/g.35163 Transcript_18737/m.35163 type:complete len:333 (-) Transcript_18737:111-1109(-)